MTRFWNTALLSAALAVPIALAPAALRADDRNDNQRVERTYHDRQRNDDHQWNNNEDQAYRAWGKQNHRKYKDFSRMKERDRQNYWGWRHDHSDAILKIDIH